MDTNNVIHVIYGELSLPWRAKGFMAVGAGGDELGWGARANPSRGRAEDFLINQSRNSRSVHTGEMWLD